eukprot:TRINITY_DN7973_c0_g1_i5.p1 TRINITY_DN7973_c0_g1~~TRINITY_DN7973_c0_g1_i5.p1  ORF type:complete len:280 (-),score=65.02 TRINITY_DN7973_c0_g1_i5:101-862(-)
METKLDRLFALLESGSSNATRKAAAEQIGTIVKSHPHDLPVLLERVNKYLLKKEWETRTAAGFAIDVIAENTPTWNPPPVTDPNMEPVVTTGKLSFSIFSVESVMQNGTPLLASGGQEFDYDELENMSIDARLALQQKQIEEKLGLFVSLGGPVIKNEDLICAPSTKRNSSVAPPPPKEDTELTKQIKELEAAIADPSQSSRKKNTAKRKLKELKKQKETSSAPMSYLRMLKYSSKITPHKYMHMLPRLESFG